MAASFNRPTFEIPVCIVDESKRGAHRTRKDLMNTKRLLAGYRTYKVSETDGKVSSFRKKGLDNFKYLLNR